MLPTFLLLLVFMVLTAADIFLWDNNMVRKQLVPLDACPYETGKQEDSCLCLSEWSRASEPIKIAWDQWTTPKYGLGKARLS
jgi:hypothetical protein